MANINGTRNNDILVDTDLITDDHFNGKGGIDTLVFDFAWTEGDLFDMTTGQRTAFGLIRDTFKNIENLTLGGGADVIGDDNDNVIKFLNTGDDHDNEVHAGGGNDKVLGGIGHDMLYGDAGKDILKGGGRGDELYGGGGKDILIGGGGDDGLFGDAGNDTLKGGNGSDILYGGTGADILKGGGDNDFLFGENGKDILKGGKGNDSLDGGAGNDTLKGGNGRDLLLGHTGDDVLIGGKGADTFIFSSDGGANVIEDFQDSVDFLDQTDFDFVDVDDALSQFFELDQPTTMLSGSIIVARRSRSKVLIWPISTRRILLSR